MPDADRYAERIAGAMDEIESIGAKTAEPMTDERLAEIRDRADAATRGPWEPGMVWLVAGLIWDDDHRRADPDKATHCGYCHHGEPVWSGQRNINGTVMNAHRHRASEPYGIEHLISAADGDLVAGNYDYEDGGIIAPADTAFVAAARQDVPDLLTEVERLRGELADLAAQNAKTECNFEEFAECIIPERDRLAAFVGRLRELVFMGGQGGETVRRSAQQAFAEFDEEPDR